MCSLECLQSTDFISHILPHITATTVAKVQLIGLHINVDITQHFHQRLSLGISKARRK